RTFAGPSASTAAISAPRAPSPTRSRRADHEADTLEQVADGARGAGMAAVLAEGPAKVRARAVAVIGHALDHHGRAAGAVAFEADRLDAVGVGRATRRPLLHSPSARQRVRGRWQDPRSARSGASASHFRGAPCHMLYVHPLGVAGHS